jgi:hypothetical protein
MNQQERPAATGNDAGTDAAGLEGIETDTTVGCQRQDAWRRLRTRNDHLCRIAASVVRHNSHIPGYRADPTGKFRQIVLGGRGLQIQLGCCASWQKPRGRGTVTRNRLHGGDDHQQTKRDLE